MKQLFLLFAFLFVLSFFARAQQEPVKLEIDAGLPVGEMRPIYAFFGYDEPNYTYSCGYGYLPSADYLWHENQCNPAPNLYFL
jgi:hypothetical protein